MQNRCIDFWHFDIIGISWCLHSRGQLKQNKTKQTGLMPVYKFMSVQEMLNVAIKCTTTAVT